MVAFIEQNTKKALRLVKTTEFVTPVIYGYDDKYAPFLLSFGAKTTKRQLLLIDNKSGKIFFRMLLPLSKPADDSYRKEMTTKAKKSFLRINKIGIDN